MRKILNLLALLTLTVGFVSCETDNYDAPESGIAGTIYTPDGNPMQVGAGKTSMQIKIVERSFAKDASTVVTPQYLNLRQEGTYTNDKLFAGTYEVLPIEGAFYPLDEETEMKTVTLSGGKITTQDFTVIPYLYVEFIGNPYLTEEGYLECAVKFIRNSKEGVAMPDVNNMQLYISHTQYCGPSGDENYISPTVSIANAQDGETIYLRSKIPFKYSGTYWIRVGACCNDQYKKYNFTEIKKVEVKLDNKGA